MSGNDIVETYNIIVSDVSLMADESQLEYEDEQADGRPAQAAAQDSGTDLPYKEGAVFGAIAVIVTYLTHLFLTVVATAQTTPTTYTDDGSLVVTDMVASWQAAGWSYVAAFGAGFEADGETATLGDAPNQAAAMGSAPFFMADTLLFLISVGLVVVAGYAVANYVEADDAVEAAKAGVTIVPAYLIFGAIVAFAMTHTYSDAVLVESVLDSAGTVDPEPFLNDEAEITGDIDFAASTTGAVGAAGLVVPGVLGVVGGLITQWRDALERLMAQVQ